MNSRPDAMDDRLDRALASYTPENAPLGLEQRLLARLAAAGKPRPRRVPPIFYWAMAASVLVAVAVGAAVLHPHGQESATEARSDHPRAGSPASKSPQVERTLPPQPTRAASPARPARKPSPMSREDAIALSEMRAPSHPAPEFPLTAEEKLLQRIAQSGNPRQQALLNPEVCEKQEAVAEAEFHEFVEQSIKGERK